MVDKNIKEKHERCEKPKITFKVVSYSKHGLTQSQNMDRPEVNRRSCAFW